MKQNKILWSGLSHTKKEKIHGEVHTEYVLNPFSGQREPLYFIDGVHVDTETLKIENNYDKGTRGQDNRTSSGYS
jgi:hypothetical protein